LATPAPTRTAAESAAETMMTMMNDYAKPCVKRATEVGGPKDRGKKEGMQKEGSPSLNKSSIEL
jgi:hypothetical protein